MRKFIGITVAIVLLSASVTATDFVVELEAHYLFPSEKAFKDIYGGGMMYGGEATIQVWKNIIIWFGGSTFSKTGELTFTKEETKLKITPIGGGLKYRTQTGIVNFYGGLGINYYQYKETNPIGDVSKSGPGITGKIGIYIKAIEGLLIDVYFNYSYCKIKPADYKINIGGIEIGVGIGYEFKKE